MRSNGKSCSALNVEVLRGRWLAAVLGIVGCAPRSDAVRPTAPTPVITAIPECPPYVRSPDAGIYRETCDGGTMGGLSKDLIHREIHVHEEEVRRCYNELLARGNFEGDLALKWVIGPDGRVQTACVAKATPSLPPALVSCVGQRVRDFRFPSPQCGGVVSVTFPWQFRVGNQSAQLSADNSESEVEQDVTIHIGSLPKEEIRKVVRTHRREIRSCYEAALTDSPPLSAKVSLKFVIGANGKVETASVVQGAPATARLEGCLVGTVLGWEFPKPEGGGTVTVTYPFIFKAG
jgi:outer membrane biosynthesis protein TonB